MMMQFAKIGQYRLFNQEISVHHFSKPAELVGWMGALQAQDFLGAKWSIALRLPAAKDADIEAAIQNKTIVRSWGLRGTLHFMASQDIGWMLKLVAPRIVLLLDGQYRKRELDKSILLKSQKLLVGALRDSPPLTRSELKVVLEKGHIRTENMRINFILLKAALDGIICLGPRKGKEFTYVLLADWVPSQEKKTREESLAMLAKMYFRSHGPATIADLSWWSGLTIKDSKVALESMSPGLKQLSIQGRAYYMDYTVSIPKKNSRSIYLLPGFDEYLLGYSDRRAVMQDAHKKKIMGSGNGIFKATIVINGAIAGSWKRTFAKNGLVIAIDPFIPLDKSNTIRLEQAIKSFCNYLEMQRTDEPT
jgi:hypothetical protein